MNMKGIMLCGGNATRLDLLTRVTNKHLLPVGNKPMCLHPLKTLTDMGVKDICVVIGGRNVGKFTEFLGDGGEFGARIYYRYQKQSLGIAHAIALCHDFIGEEPFVVILGDNIFKGKNQSLVDIASFKYDEAHSEPGAVMVLCYTKTPERFGIAQLRKGKVVGIVEKPPKYIGRCAITGLYFFDSRFFDYFMMLTPSMRGEFEITDILKMYNIDDSLHYVLWSGDWTDAGTPESLKVANEMFE
ncbi:UTP--glucose-1-phosphate uridylyltransferase AglF [uncultured archaeon]|nr:UTP--glucose-1-phosphate uridylyltransferase AglF [uncultured archaeon]